MKVTMLQCSEWRQSVVGESCRLSSWSDLRVEHQAGTIVRSPVVSLFQYLAQTTPDAGCRQDPNWREQRTTGFVLNCNAPPRVLPFRHQRTDCSASALAIHQPQPLDHFIRISVVVGWLGTSGNVLAAMSTAGTSARAGSRALALRLRLPVTASDRSRRHSPRLREATARRYHQQ